MKVKELIETLSTLDPEAIVDGVHSVYQLPAYYDGYARDVSVDWSQDLGNIKVKHINKGNKVQIQEIYWDDVIEEDMLDYFSENKPFEEYMSDNIDLTSQEEGRIKDISIMWYQRKWNKMESFNYFYSNIHDK